MKILYDHQIFTLQKYGGISRSFYELIKYFNKKENIDILTPIFFSNNHYIANKEDVKHVNFFPHNEFKAKRMLMSFFNKNYAIKRINEQNFNVFHPTYYDTYFLDHIGDKPFVVTVHDMIHEKFNNFFAANDRTSNKKRILCKKASKIIAVSKNTKKDLVEIFGIKESKIEVIYHGNAIESKSLTGIDVKIPSKYILFIGLRDGYKNFQRFINSLSFLLNDNDLNVVCVGGGKFNNRELAMFNTLCIGGRIFQFNLDDNILERFYSNALMFVFPSLYEGFGIPILESFVCKCPLVCSNTSSLPEIAREGAEYFNPYSEESICNAVKNILFSDEKRKLLIKNGIERLNDFSWEKTGKQTEAVYDKVM